MIYLRKEWFSVRPKVAMKGLIGEVLLFDRCRFGERKSNAGFETELSSMHRSTSTCAIASSEDALASFLRSEVACV